MSDLTLDHTILPERFAAWGIAWPGAHPETGEPFVSADRMTLSGGRRPVHHLPPSRPSRTIATAWETVYNDDGDEYEEPTAWRDLTDEEWAEALAHYERIKDRTVTYVASPVVVEARFRTESGATADGIGDGKAWTWTGWSVPPGVVWRALAE